MEALPQMGINVPADYDGNGGNGEAEKGKPIIISLAIFAAVIAVLFVLSKGTK